MDENNQKNAEDVNEFKKHYDPEISRTVKTLTIPIIVTVAFDDNTRNPIKYHTNLFRSSYLYLILPSLMEYCEKLNQPGLDVSKCWFEYNNIPLKWHLPVGLLYDQFELSSPWKIQLNLKNFPNDLFIFENEQMVLDLFMSTIKEADYLRTGSIKRVMGISKLQQETLWDSLKNTGLDSFNINAIEVLYNLEEPIRSIPVRLYLKDGMVLRRLVKSRESLKVMLEELQVNEYKEVVLHGCKLHLDTDLVWLYMNASFMDTFLHLIVR
ncbi:autophagy protein Apg5-domain-containing protein [Globomyces pollinis-pini]|nr:autophagy protein Apg5-domain-containing protein [Globomyces pollinis-pini]